MGCRRMPGYAADRLDGTPGGGVRGRLQTWGGRMMETLASMFNSIPAGPDHSGLAAAFDTTTPAESPEPVPAGEYPVRAVDARLGENRRGTPQYVMRLEIADGEHAGRRLVWRAYLSPAALPHSKRDLARLGLGTYGQLETGAVPGGLLMARVALRKDDSGTAFNEVRALEPVPRTAIPPAPSPASPAAQPQPEPPAPATTVDELPARLVDTGLM